MIFRNYFFRVKLFSLVLLGYQLIASARETACGRSALFDTLSAALRCGQRGWSRRFAALLRALFGWHRSLSQIVRTQNKRPPTCPSTSVLDWCSVRTRVPPTGFPPPHCDYSHFPL